MSSSHQLNHRFIWGVVIFVFLFQWAHLNFPALNGDEALYLLMTEQIGKWKSGMGMNLNPIIDYSGPLDFWILGSVYQSMAFFPSIAPAAWMVRIVPFILFLLGVFSLFYELKKWSKSLSLWFLFFAATVPMALVYSRWAWPHAIVFSGFFFLLGEVFRIKRTNQVRWIPTALVAGLTFEANTIAFLGVGVVFLPVIGSLLKGMKQKPGSFLLGFGIVLALAYPVIRNFPPPLSNETGGPFVFQLRSLMNIITGIQPFELLLRRDPAPLWVPALLLFGIVGAMGYQLRELFFRKSKLDRLLLALWGTHLVATIYILITCTRGRTLVNPGTERYFLSLTPGWILLQSDAFLRLSQRFFRSPKQTFALLASLFLLTFGRLGWSVIQSESETDPSLLAARWLQSVCRRGECVAYAENFWNYWPIRYYTRDSIDLNYITFNWKGGAYHSPQGKKVAACWYLDSGTLYSGWAEDQVTFENQKAAVGQRCFLGIQAPR